MVENVDFTWHHIMPLSPSLSLSLILHYTTIHYTTLLYCTLTITVTVLYNTILCVLFVWCAAAPAAAVRGQKC